MQTPGQQQPDREHPVGQDSHAEAARQSRLLLSDHEQRTDDEDDDQ